MKKTEKSKNSASKKTVNSSDKKTKVVTKDKIVVKDNSNINPDYTDAFIQEVNEDLQNDNMRELWKKYGVYIFSIVVVAVSLTVGYGRINEWIIRQNQEKTMNYMNATRVQDSAEKSIEALQKIYRENNGIYSDLARLQIANILFSEQKKDDALATLLEIVNDKKANVEIQQIALIKYATYMVDSMSKEDFEKLVQPVLEVNNSWTPLAKDMLALIAIRDGDFNTAKKIYNNLLQLNDLSDDFKSKIKDVLSSINDM